MKTKISFLLFFISVSLWCSPILFLTVDSYIGSYYYPEREDKEFSYHELHDLRFGVEEIEIGASSIMLEARHSEKLLDQVIKLQTMQIIYEPTYSWRFKFKLDDIGYGKRSKWFDRDLANPDFRTYLLGNYRFAGVDLSYHISQAIRIGSYLGGNVHNTAIFGTEISYQTSRVYFKLFNLNLGRDNQFNKQMCSIGSEISWRNRYLELFDAQTYQYLSSVFERENYIGYSELVFPLQPNLKTGVSFYHAKTLRGYSRWRELSFQLQYDFRNLDLTLQASRVKSEELLSERISNTLMYKLTDNFSVGINSAVHYPQYKSEYYNIGFQVSYAQKLHR